MAVLLLDKNNLGSRHKALIQLLMKSEGDFGGSWCEHLVQHEKLRKLERKPQRKVELALGFSK